MKWNKRIIVLLGVLLFFANDWIAGMFRTPDTILFYHFKEGLTSLTFFILSTIVFWTSARYLKVFMRWFMVLCFLDFYDKTRIEVSAVDIYNSYLVIEIAVLAIVELFFVYINKHQKEE